MINYADMPTELLKEKVLQQWHLVNKMASRRFSKESLADEAALYVLNCLEKEGWQRLRTFTGKSSFRTFFASITFRLLEDFARKKFGRRLPPLWIRKLGSLWTLLFQLLCLERFSFLDAINIVISREPSLTEDSVERIAETILGEVPHCGEHTAVEIELMDEDTLHSATSSTPETDYDKDEKDSFLRGLSVMIFGGTMEEKEQAAIDKLLATPPPLDDEERLLLRLCFQETRTISSAGQMMGLNRFQAHGRLKRILARIERHFERHGCHDALKALLAKESS